MICSHARAAFAGMLFAALSAAARADDCKLGRIASLDFTDNGAIVVPVSLEGTTMPMAIDTGGEGSSVDPVVAGSLHLIEHPIFQGMMYDAKGEQFTNMAVLHTLGMGDMHASNVKMLVWPSRMSENGAVAGIIAPDLLRQFDVDLDFGAHKLNLFSQNHCPGKVVYWTSADVAVVPVHILNGGHIVLPVTLDGHKLDAMLDTGSTHSILSMEFARNLFGLTPQSPDMTRVGTISGAVQTEVYRHSFKSLGMEGVTIGNPVVYLHDNLVNYSLTQGPHLGSRLSDVNAAYAIPEFTLGLEQVRHLHLYIAYKEQALYITGTSAPPAAVPGPAAPTPATAAH